MFRPTRPADVSEEAFALHLQSETIDLHLDGFIWQRTVGYDVHKFHSGGPLGRHFGGHLDLPRAHMAGLDAGGWSITTNPFRSAGGRWRAFQANLAAFTARFDWEDGLFAPRIATDAAAYRRLRGLDDDDVERNPVHVVLPAIQGANALEAAPDGVASIPGDVITRITLVHLTNSCYGVTSAPFAGSRRGEGLTQAGKALVEQMNERRIFVDLAHINEAGFWDAVAVHDKSLPLIVTHTGVDGACPHWRNLDDAQIKAVAESGGVIGVIFEPTFLRSKGGPRDGRMVVQHLQHIVSVAGEDFAALGSDYDGMISPPDGLVHDGYARLTQWMLDLGWSHERIAKILGGNFLRAFAALRPGKPEDPGGSEPERADGPNAGAPAP